MLKMPKRIDPSVAKKCDQICASIKAGTTYMALKGKRLDVREADGRIRIYIPVGYRHRLVCLFDGRVTVPHELLPHENYNKKYCQ